MTKALFEHAAIGANPTNRGKQGVKRSLLTDGGVITLAIEIDGANRHDVKLLSVTLDGLVIARQEPNEEKPQQLRLDANYDWAAMRRDVENRHSLVHIRSHGEEKRDKALTLGLRTGR